MVRNNAAVLSVAHVSEVRCHIALAQILARSSAEIVQHKFRSIRFAAASFLLGVLNAVPDVAFGLAADVLRWIALCRHRRSQEGE